MSVSILTRNVQLLEPTLILVILKHIFQLGARVKQLLIRQLRAGSTMVSVFSKAQVTRDKRIKEIMD